MRVCNFCGSPFEPGYPPQRFCSRACHLRNVNSSVEHQRAAGKIGGGARGAQKREASSGLGYRKVAGTHEHRAVAAQALGRDLRAGEVVHHEDRNKQNNDPRNLVVFASQAEHARHHKLNHYGPCGTCKGLRLEEVMQSHV